MIPETPLTLNIKQHPDPAKSPGIIRVGPSLILLALPELCKVFGMAEANMRHLCRTYGVPVLTLPGGLDTGYINLYALESALFHATGLSQWSGDTALERTHQELAGVTYGAFSQEMIRKRLKGMVSSLTKAAK